MCETGGVGVLVVTKPRSCCGEGGFPFIFSLKGLNFEVMAQQRLPPGFRFHPTDVELVAYYLKEKINGRPIEMNPIAVVDLYKCEPWDLPGMYLWCLFSWLCLEMSEMYC